MSSSIRTCLSLSLSSENGRRVRQGGHRTTLTTDTETTRLATTRRETHRICGFKQIQCPSRTSPVSRKLCKLARESTKTVFDGRPELSMKRGQLSTADLRQFIVPLSQGSAQRMPFSDINDNPWSTTVMVAPWKTPVGALDTEGIAPAACPALAPPLSASKATACCSHHGNWRFSGWMVRRKKGIRWAKGERHARQRRCTGEPTLKR